MKVAVKYIENRAEIDDLAGIEYELSKLQTAPSEQKRLDGMMKGVLNKASGDIIKAMLPVGQIKPFPKNNMALMTVSGAKGSAVNFSQISCLLGQQEYVVFIITSLS